QGCSEISRRTLFHQEPMFTGIVEAEGEVVSSRLENNNLGLTVCAPFTNELRPGQSVSHQGVCLTVETISGENYSVTAVNETLLKTNLGGLKPGDKINLERAMSLGSRIDGHLVQGHVDGTVVCRSAVQSQGSTV